MLHLFTKTKRSMSVQMLPSITSRRSVRRNKSSLQVPKLGTKNSQINSSFFLTFAASKMLHDQPRCRKTEFWTPFCNRNTARFLIMRR